MKPINIVFGDRISLWRVFIFFLFIPHTQIIAQRFIKPAAAIIANTRQSLCFGSFTHGVAGGTVIVHPDGTRAATGDIILLTGTQCSPAVFEITVKPGSLVSIINGPATTLTDTKAGSVRLLLGNTSTGNAPVFNEISPGHMLATVGGSLTVTSSQAGLSGNFTGAFSVIFIEE